MSYLATILDALVFGFAVAAVPIGLVLVLLNVSEVGSILLAMPVFWTCIDA